MIEIKRSDETATTIGSSITTRCNNAQQKADAIVIAGRVGEPCCTASEKGESNRDNIDVK